MVKLLRAVNIGIGCLKIFELPGKSAHEFTNQIFLVNAVTGAEGVPVEKDIPRKGFSIDREEKMKVCARGKALNKGAVRHNVCQQKVSDLPLVIVDYVVNENSSHSAITKEAGHEKEYHICRA